MRTMPEPTDAMPGTVEKLMVMQSRYANGEELFHPCDNQDNADANPYARLLVGGEREPNYLSNGRRTEIGNTWKYHERTVINTRTWTCRVAPTE